MTDAQSALAQVREALQRVVQPAVLLTTTKEVSIILDHVEAQEAENEKLRGLLDDVRRCFTRDDDLPDDLLPRIDAALKEQR